MHACLLGLACLLASCASAPRACGQAWDNPKDGMRFVWIPAGSFTAEVPVESKDPNDCGEDVAAIDGLRERLLARPNRGDGRAVPPVRQGDGLCHRRREGRQPVDLENPGFPQKDSHPVVYLSYGDAVQYARWAGVDLPTEAEWLYACKAGTSTVFHWGDELDDRYVWHRATPMAQAPGRSRANCPTPGDCTNGRKRPRVLQSRRDMFCHPGRGVDPLSLLSRPHGITLREAVRRGGLPPFGPVRSESQVPAVPLGR